MGKVVALKNRDKYTLLVDLFISYYLEKKYWWVNLAEHRRVNLTERYSQDPGLTKPQECLVQNRVESFLN